MKTIKHKIYIPIYGCHLIIIVAKDINKSGKKYGFKNLKFSDAGVLTRKDKNGNKEYIYIQRSVITYGAIAHEAKHIVNRIFRDRGVKLDNFNDEAECYLLDYIVNKIHININKKK